MIRDILCKRQRCQNKLHLRNFKMMKYLLNVSFLEKNNAIEYEIMRSGEIIQLSGYA